MNSILPPIESIRSDLLRLPYADIQRLANVSKVPFTTLWKIRDGITKNPGIETVRLFYPHMARELIEAKAA